MRVANEVQVSWNFHPPANFSNNAAHDSPLTFKQTCSELCQQLSSQLFIPCHYSSSRAHQLTVGSSELLLLFLPVFIIQFPHLSPSFSLVVAATHRQSATLRAATLYLPPWNFPGLLFALWGPRRRPARAFFWRSDHRSLCASPSKFLSPSPVCLEYQQCESDY